MTHKLSKLVPVGINAKPVLMLSIAGIVLCSLISFSQFYTKLMNSLNEISRFDDSGNRVFSQYAKMDTFASINSNFYVFRIFFLCFVLFAVYCFLYHFIGSKSLYTMRRLKNPLELYLRCLAVSVIFILLGVALIYLLNFICIKIYLSAVPEESLHPLWDKDIWRDLL